jgi:RimJ/RimL family protein N-acetyltransferase
MTADPGGDLFALLDTPRLTLRCPRAADAAALAALITPEVSRWLSSWPPMLTAGEALVRVAQARAAIVERSALYFAIERRDDAAVIGWLLVRRVMLESRRAELGYWMGPAFHGSGYMTEAAHAALGFAFAWLDVDTIEAGAQPDNHPSFEVMRRLHMTPIGRRTVWTPSRGREEVCEFFAIDRETFAAQRLPAGAHRPA